jgi:hypothetical protein
LYRSTHRLCRAGATVENLAHSASLQPLEKLAPSNSGIKHLVAPLLLPLLAHAQCEVERTRENRAQREVVFDPAHATSRSTRPETCGVCATRITTSTPDQFARKPRPTLRKTITSPTPKLTPFQKPEFFKGDDLPRHRKCNIAPGRMGFDQRGLALIG